jgi:hypothetical protein
MRGLRSACRAELYRALEPREFLVPGIITSPPRDASAPPDPPSTDQAASSERGRWSIFARVCLRASTRRSIVGRALVARRRTSRRRHALAAAGDVHRRRRQGITS